jgi:hypothetical protein
MILTIYNIYIIYIKKVLSIKSKFITIKIFIKIDVLVLHNLVTEKIYLTFDTQFCKLQNKYLKINKLLIQC